MLRPFSLLLFDPSDSFFLLFTFNKFNEYNSANSVKKFQCQNIIDFIPLIHQGIQKHTEVYSFANFFDKFLDPSLNA